MKQEQKAERIGFERCDFLPSPDELCDKCGACNQHLYYRRTDYFVDEGEYWCLNCCVKEYEINESDALKQLNQPNPLKAMAIINIKNQLNESRIKSKLIELGWLPPDDTLKLKIELASLKKRNAQIEAEIRKLRVRG